MVLRFLYGYVVFSMVMWFYGFTVLRKFVKADCNFRTTV